MKSDQETRCLISVITGIVFTYSAIFYYIDLEYKSIVEFTNEGKMVTDWLILALIITGLFFFLYAAYQSFEEKKEAYYSMGILVVIYFLISLYFVGV